MSVCRQLTSVTAMWCSLPKRRIPFSEICWVCRSKEPVFCTHFIVHERHFQHIFIYSFNTFSSNWSILKLTTRNCLFFLKMRLKKENRKYFKFLWMILRFGNTLRHILFTREILWVSPFSFLFRPAIYGYVNLRVASVKA